VKLSRELSKRDTGKTLYILDEPTTGLHFEDIKQLLEVLHRLRDHGNTVVIIEHNLDVIKTADWIVDLGPEGGSGGGHIIATGTPEDVAGSPGPRALSPGSSWGPCSRRNLLERPLEIVSSIAAPTERCGSLGKLHWPKTRHKKAGTMPGF
jgi:energy-coupling factor transporter ATP-binding protein EcfA2